MIYKSSIFKHLLTTFVVIFLVLYAIGLFIINKGTESVRFEIENSMRERVTYYIGFLESEIERITRLQYNMINNPDINRLASISESMDQYERTRTILSVQSYLADIKESSKFIDDVAVHFQSIGLTISVKNGIQPLFTENYYEFRNFNPSSLSGLRSWNDRLYLAVSYPWSNHNTPQFIIEISLSNEILQSDLLLSQGYEHSFSTLHMKNTPYRLYQHNDLHNGRTINEALAMLPSGSGVTKLTLDGVRYLVSYQTSEELQLTLTRFIPYDVVYKTLRLHQIWMWIFTIAAIVIIFLYALWVYRYIHRPLSQLVRAFLRVQRGEMRDINYGSKNEFGYLFSAFNEMTQKLNSMIDQVYKQQILTQRAELKQLQSQINPHFLYNSFFVLHRRIKGGDYENALQFSQHLGNYFRYLTRSADDVVPLYKEVEHAAIYAEIQGMRFFNRIRIDFGKLPPEFAAMNVPRLILQPIIENAFEHGLEQVEENGLLSVQFFDEESRLCIAVQNNGGSIEYEKLQAIQELLNRQDDGIETTGIINIHRRIWLYFGEGSGLSMEQNENGGVKVVIRLGVLHQGGGTECFAC